MEMMDSLIPRGVKRRSRGRAATVSWIALLWWLTMPFAAWAAEASTSPAAPPADLVLMNLPVVTLRAELGGTPPAVRVARAQERFDKLDRRELGEPVTQLSGRLGNVSGVAVQVGNRILFSVVDGDLDPEQPGQTVESVAATAAAQLQTALDARRDQLHWPTILRGTGYSLAALLLLLGLLWSIARGRRRLDLMLRRALESRLRTRTSGRFDWSGALLQLANSIAQIVGAALIALLIFLWLDFALEQFPLTRPLGQRMGAFLLGLLGHVGTSMLDAVPGLVTVAVILLITRAVHKLVVAIFIAVQRGQVTVPGMHPETAGATRRIASTVVWALGLTFAYPYIPGSQSDVFKGLSVLFGFMVTLGSANIVNQIMSGMVLVYSRALRRGDMVDIGGTIGTVTSLDSLSVKIVNVRREEVTLPNAVVVGSAIHNYSRRGGSEANVGALVSTSVTIGYDAPWRQIHGMLIRAAATVPGLGNNPPPYVLQRGLQDFYVEYELFCSIDDPRRRFELLSILHAAIQDEFNRNGVQIMSPHYMDQPPAPVVVSPDNQYAAPGAEKT